MQEIITKMLEGNIQTKQNILNSDEIKQTISQITQTIIQALDNGKKIITMGNGGSSCDALHLTHEFVGRYKGNRKPLKSICLAADPTVMTCIGNDYGYENLFARQIEAHTDQGDIVIGYSTSGTSKNIIKAFQKAKELGAIIIGMSGNQGGDFPEICDHLFLAPTQTAAHMQEAHTLVTHIICEALDKHYNATDK